jgi:hypothetical protein
VTADGAGLGVAWKATRQDKNASFGEAADISFGEPVNAAPAVIDGAHTLARSRSTAKAD